MLRLWTRLRVSTLGAIWQTRTARTDAGDAQPFAHRAIRLAISKLAEAIRRDWARTQEDMRMLDDGSFCSAWWRGFDARLKPEDFEDQWPPVFHRIRGGPAGQGQQDIRYVEIVLTPAHIPLPSAN